MNRILAALEQHARQRPVAIALQGDEAVFNWQELRAAVVQLAARLEGSASLGLLMENSPAWVIADLATLRLGITCVPIPPFFSQEQIRHAVADANIQVLLTDNPSLLESVCAIDQREHFTLADKNLCLLKLQDMPELRYPGIAKITYTSGTTGKPRGVLLKTDVLEEVADSLCQAAQAGPEDRALALLPLSTLLENIASLYVSILAGAQMLVPVPASLGLQGSSKLDASMLAGSLQLLRPSAVILPPQLLKVFIGLASACVLPDSLRFIAVGGAPLALKQLQQAEALGLPVYQGYGFSEAASVVALNRPAENRPGSVGRLLPHCQLRIGEDGEIFIKGATFSGYVHAEPVPPDSWLSSGDLGYLDDDGYLYINGRKREVIITSFGRNVSPEWVEAELLAEPAIAQAAVFGNQRPFLSAVLVPAAGVTPQDLQAAISRCNARLPDYARVMGSVLAQQPFNAAQGELTANGRPRRQVIHAHYQTMLEKSYEDAS